MIWKTTFNTYLLSVLQWGLKALKKALIQDRYTPSKKEILKA